MATKSELERLAVVETKVDNILDELRSVNKKLDDQDKKFASKLSERVVYGLVAAILLFVVNGWLQLFKIPAIQVITPDSTTETTTTTTPTGSTSTGTTRETPSATATAEAQSTSDNPNDSQSVTDGVVDLIPKVGN